MFRPSGIATLALAMSLPIAACDGNTTGSQYGSVTIKLTDAPGIQINQAWVTFTDVYLQGENGETDPPASRFYLMQDGNEEFELTSLQNDVADMLVGVGVPAGDYGQLRVVLGDACIVSGDAIYATPGYDKCGTPTGTIQMASTDQTGVKVLLNGLHVGTGHYELVLDFSVGESFAHQSSADVVNLRPVIRGADVSLVSAIDATLVLGQDVVMPDGFSLGDFTVTMDNGSDLPTTLPFTDDDNDGTFSAHFQYEMAGDYTFTLTGPEGLTVTTDPVGAVTLTLASGDTQTVGWVVATAEAAAP